jgi:hypothetical protein
VSLPTITGVAKLLGDPKSGPTKSGGSWTNAILKFTAWRKVDDEWTEGEGVVAAAIAFDDVAAQLAAFRKGDPIEIHGTASLGLWNDAPQLRVTLGGCRRPLPRQKQQRERDEQPAAAPVRDLRTSVLGADPQRDELAARREAGQRLARAHRDNPRLTPRGGVTDQPEFSARTPVSPKGTPEAYLAATSNVTAYTNRATRAMTATPDETSDGWHRCLNCGGKLGVDYDRDQPGNDGYWVHDRTGKRQCTSSSAAVGGWPGPGTNSHAGNPRLAERRRV